MPSRYYDRHLWSTDNDKTEILRDVVREEKPSSQLDATCPVLVPRLVPQVAKFLEGRLSSLTPSGIVHAAETPP